MEGEAGNETGGWGLERRENHGKFETLRNEGLMKPTIQIQTFLGCIFFQKIVLSSLPLFEADYEKHVATQTLGSGVLAGVEVKFRTIRV